MKEVKISNLQYGLLVFTFFFGSTLIYNPAESTKTDAWITMILGTIGGLVLITMFLYIAKLNSGKTLTEILENCFGKVFGKVISIYYIIFYLYKSSLNTRLFVGFMNSVSFTETPVIVIFIVLSIATLYSARGGLTVIGKTSEILAPLLLLSSLIISTSIFTIKDFTSFTPILLEIAPVIKSAVNLLSTVFGDIFIFLLITPYINSKNGLFKTTYWVTFIFFLIVESSILRNIIVVGPLMGTLTYTSHVSAQLIPTINIEPIIDISLLIGVGFKIVICLYAVSKITADIFKLEEYKPILTAFAVLNIALGYIILPKNADVFIDWTKSYGQDFIAFLPDLFFPLLMLVISIVKNRKKTQDVCA